MILVRPCTLGPGGNFWSIMAFVALFLVTSGANANVSRPVCRGSGQQLLAERKSRKKKKKRNNKRKKLRSLPPIEQTSQGDQPVMGDKPELEDVPSVKDDPGQSGWQYRQASPPAKTVPSIEPGDKASTGVSGGSISDVKKNKNEISSSELGPRTEKKDDGVSADIAQADFLLDVRGGILVQRGGRVDPGADLDVGWNLGKILGWPGLYLAARVDIFIGDSPLGAGYLMMDTGAGFMGRIPLGPVSLRAMLEFDVRKMFITNQGSSGNISPSLGLGFGLGADLDFALTRWLLILIGGSTKLMQDPLTGKFEFSAVARGGVGFAF